MTKHQETPAFPSTYDDTATASGCGCFRRFCFRRDEDETHSSLLHDKEGGQPELWLVAKLKKLREWSEVVAGPKWKNSIRKMGRICNPRKHSKAAAEFRYSPESYALNFAGGDREEDGDLLHSFSTKFAPGFDQQRRPPPPGL